MQAKQFYENVVHKWVNICCSEIKTWKGYENFNVTVKIDWSPRRTHSRGGYYKAGPGISMGLYPLTLCPPSLPFRVHEYPSFDKDPVIGGIVTYDVSDRVGLITCHEMAHAAQYYAYIDLKKPRCAPHGPLFKSHYAKLRKIFNNGLQVPQNNFAASR